MRTKPHDRTGVGGTYMFRLGRSGGWSVSDVDILICNVTHGCVLRRREGGREGGRVKEEGREEGEERGRGEREGREGGEGRRRRGGGKEEENITNDILVHLNPFSLSLTISFPVQSKFSSSTYPILSNRSWNSFRK